MPPPSNCTQVIDFLTLVSTINRLIAKDTGKIICQNPASLDYWGNMCQGPPTQVDLIIVPQPLVLLKETILSRLFQLEEQLFEEFIEDISTGFEWQGVLRVPAILATDCPNNSWQFAAGDKCCI